MKVRINKVVAESYVDGPGKRSVVFFQGCPLACPGCQNKALWDKGGGQSVDVESLAAELGALAGRGGNVTISGGEPTLQPGALATLVTLLKGRYGVGHIIVYTGFRFEQLLDISHPLYVWLYSVLQAVDVIVDGPFIREYDDPMITYRGSRNQRPIDVQATRAAGKVVTLDWDSPEIVLTATGDLLLPVGLAPEFVELGQVKKTRMCGQTKELRP